MPLAPPLDCMLYQSLRPALSSAADGGRKKSGSLFDLPSGHSVSNGSMPRRRRISATSRPGLRPRLHPLPKHVCHAPEDALHVGERAGDGVGDGVVDAGGRTGVCQGCSIRGRRLHLDLAYSVGVVPAEPDAVDLLRSFKPREEVEAELELGATEGRDAGGEVGHGGVGAGLVVEELARTNQAATPNANSNLRRFEWRRSGAQGARQGPGLLASLTIT